MLFFLSAFLPLLEKRLHNETTLHLIAETCIQWVLFVIFSNEDQNFQISILIL